MRGLLRVGLVVGALLGPGCGRPDTATAVGGGGSAVRGMPNVPAAALAPATAGEGVPVRDQVTLVEALQAHGVMVTALGDIAQPFLTGKGTRLGLRGPSLPRPGEVQAFAYDSSTAAAADIEQLDAGGNPRTTIVEWIGPPHFFLRERVLVLYVGQDAPIANLLQNLLGGQVRGK